MKRMSILFIAVLMAWGAGSRNADAKELVLGNFISAKAYHNRVMYPFMMKSITEKSGGSLTWKFLPGGQVVTGRGTMAGIRDGIIDAGFVVPVFTRKELAASNVVFDMLFYGTDTIAVSAASVETIMLDCPQCTAEYRKQNAVYLAGYAVAPFKLLCRGKITSLAQIKGMKIRSSGGAYGRWIKQLGGVPINMSGPAGAPAMQRGALDCSIASVAWLLSFGYFDVTKSIIDFPMGASRGIGIMVMNRKTWKGLSGAEKKAVMDSMAMSQAKLTIEEYIIGDAKKLKLAKKKGLTVTKGGSDFQALLDDHLKKEEKAIPKSLKKLGVKNPEAIMAAFKKNLKKWEGLSKNIGLDLDKYAKALDQHIYSKVDLSKL